MTCHSPLLTVKMMITFLLNYILGTEYKGNGGRDKDRLSLSFVLMIMLYVYG